VEREAEREKLKAESGERECVGMWVCVEREAEREKLKVESGKLKVMARQPVASATLATGWRGALSSCAGQG
jgi:hypothetical protein